MTAATRALSGAEFWKMSGSGNDFIHFDRRRAAAGPPFDSRVIGALCDRRRGIGADGIVLLEAAPDADFRMIYFNSDGSRASFCGNAALCSARLAIELGAASAGGFRFQSDVGVITGRLEDGVPAVDLPAVHEVSASARVPPVPGERRVGFALAGVPHAVILCDDADRVALERRGSAVRHDPEFPDGANVDFVSQVTGGWRMRTFERGVEGETLACGTGAVASAILLATWGETAGGETRVVTSSGLPLFVRLRRVGSGWAPTLRGSARIVFRGTLLEGDPESAARFAAADAATT